MKVLFGTEHQRLVMRNALGFISPFPRDLDSSLYSLRSRVHGQHHVEAEQFRDILGKSWEYIVIKGSAAEGQSRSLFGQGFDKLWMAMALVDCTVCGQEIEIMLVLLLIESAKNSCMLCLE